MSSKFEYVFYSCSVEGCSNTFLPYHGKVGCKCHYCDDKTPKYLRDKMVTEDMTR